MLDLVIENLEAFLAEKGHKVPKISGQSTFLQGDLPMDSLDLAVFLLVLEEKTGQDPFREGFKSFTTVGELATLYTTAAG